MNKKLSVLITGLAVVIVLVVGMVLVPIAGANPDPTVPPGYFAEIYASVTDPMTLSFDGDGNLFGEGITPARVVVQLIRCRFTGSLVAVA